MSVLFSVTDCPLYSVEITVGMQLDDFVGRQALKCYHLGVLPLVRTTVTCVQPLNGRYVTIEEKNDLYTPCMSLCDIAIYAGEYTVLLLPQRNSRRALFSFNFALLKKTEISST